MNGRWTIAALRTALCIALAAIGVTPANAVTKTYWHHDPAIPGDWFEPNNWTNGLPKEGCWTYINNGGTARITGGTAIGGDLLRLGYGSSESGTVELSGTGQLSAGAEYVGMGGTGQFIQTGGLNSINEDLWVGTYGHGTYELSGTGQLSTANQYVGVYGTGRFIQTGGSNAMDSTLYLGYEHKGEGTYELSGNGQLSAVVEYIGRGGTARFQQTGGSNTVGYLYINPKSEYLFTGGTFQIIDDGGVNLEGILDFGGSAIALDVGDNTFVNMSRGNVLGGAQASVVVGANSLTIFSAGFDPNSQLGSFSTAGMVHTAGTELVVGPGKGFAGFGVIDDHVRSEGTIHAPAGRGLDLLGGLTVFGEGSVNLGTRSRIGWDYVGGVLIVNDDVSGISDGELSTETEYIGGDWSTPGTGRFVQTGGTHTVRESISLGVATDSNGTYELSGTGKLSADVERIGASGTGRLIHTAGVNEVGEGLYVGDGRRGQGTYELSGSGQLSAAEEGVGVEGKGRFLQTGGSNAVGYLSVGAQGEYIFTGGTLQIGDQGALHLQGILDLGGSAVIIHAGEETFIDLSRGTLLGSSQGSLQVGANSLTVFPQGSDPDATFASFTTAGMVHTAGTELVVPAGQGFTGFGAIDDHVRSEGTIMAPTGRGLDLRGGLTISGEGNVDLGKRFNLGRQHVGGTLIVNDEISGVSNGQLSAEYEYIGDRSTPGTGRFIQSGGTNTISQSLEVGRYGGDGTYELSGSGQLSANSEIVGGFGSGRFIQTGGTNTISQSLEVGRSRDGTYQLIGSGQLSANSEIVGRFGSGRFIQTGGTNTIRTRLDLGFERYSDGTYELSRSGRLDAAKEYIGRLGVGRFIQTGGTNTTTEGLAVGIGPSQEGEGTYELSGTGQLFAASEWIGYRSPGKFIQSGGVNAVADGLSVGFWGGRNGERTYELGGGRLQAGWETVGDHGKGRFVQTGGQNSITDGLDVGVGENGDGTYELSDTGRLSARFQNIGNQATGQFLHMSGLSSISEGLHLGVGETGRGVYELSGTGQLSAADEYVGDTGIGRFIQTGGANSITGVLSIAPGPNSDGTYELSGAGQLSANWEVVGGYGTGRFIHTDGRNTIAKDLSLGQAVGGEGTYQLSGSGQLSAYFEAVGEEGAGQLVQTGGTNSVEFVLRLAGWEGSSGTYELSGSGQLSAEFELIGSKGTGHFIQTGGANAILGDLSVGHDAGGDGTYHLGGTGHLSANKEFIGFAGTGRFVQTGGSNVICEILRIGYEPGSHGTYTISGGSLTTSDLSVELGRLEIADSAAQITVSNRLFLGEHGTLTAVPGATIHMTGSTFENQSVNPSALAGLSDLTLTFEGGEEDIDPVEVAGWDIGPVLAGFQDNFALGTLQLGGTDVGRIRLVDEFDNRPGWDGDEALYVWNLNVGPSSHLDLSGLNLYFLAGAVDPSATIVGGTPTLVPEPSTATLSVLGMLLLIAFSRCCLRRPA